MKIRVFGEILWDIFGEEKAIGGAPFNFAAHAVKLGADVEFVSAVGNDALGREALEECAKLNIGTDKIAVINKPTGYCQVTLHDGTPEYDLVRDVAYDNIPFPGQEEMERRLEATEEIARRGETAEENSSDNGEAAEVLPADVFYFGTLAARDQVSRNTLNQLISKTRNLNPETEVFFDINIRQNYYSSQLIDESLKAATILKISREEIGVLNIPGNEEEICRAVMDKYPGLKMIIVTLDKDGAFAMERGGSVVFAPKPNCKVVSTVGAGDSFSAGFLVNYLGTGNMEDSLVKASALAGFVCEKVEAIPDYPEELIEMLQSR